MALLLMMGMGWTIAYIAVIYKGFKEKTYGIPMFAIFFNLSWEIIYGLFVPYIYGISSYLVESMTIIWLLCDILIFYTLIKYGKKHFPKNVDARWFIPAVVLGLATAFLFVLLMFLAFYDHTGIYGMMIAYMVNLIMSILFINMLISRGTAEGQSMVIAVSKFIGSFAPALSVILFYPWVNNVLLVIYLGLACSVFDIIYIILLRDTMRISKKSPPVILVGS
jgi:hypothetical protein